jgi:Tol biopolymer transport system component
MAPTSGRCHCATRGVRRRAEVLPERPLDHVRPHPPDGRRRLRPGGAHRRRRRRPGLPTHALASEAEHPTWSPDSRWIAYDLPIGTIEAVRPHGKARRTILAFTEHLGVHKPWFSPDGSSLLCMCAFNAAGGDDDLCLMNTDGTGFRNITNTPLRGENGPSWGPAPS